MTAQTTAEEVPAAPAPPSGPPRSGATGRWGPLGRLVLGLIAAIVVAAGLMLRLGLVGDHAIGAADNSDGLRLFCKAELAPAATDGKAAIHGIVVTEFRTGGPPCPMPIPATSGSEMLRATVAVATALDTTPPAPDGSQRFSLEWLAAAYAGLFALGAGVAAVAASARRRRRGAVLAAVATVLPPLLPLLAVPWWSRFLVSTYGEPAGLLGATWMAWGLLAVAFTLPRDRLARVLALALIAAGGVVAATAKPAFVPVGLVALAACVLVPVGYRRWRRHVPGLVVAVVAAALAATPVLSGARHQDGLYGIANTHDLVFTAVLPEAGPAVVPALGLQPGAWGHSGEHFYLDYGQSVPGWNETVGARPAELRSQAWTYVAEHPLVFARMVDRGLEATMLPQVRYLASETSGPYVTDGQRPYPSYPEGGKYMGEMFVYMDSVPGTWIPAALVALALLAAALTLLPHRWRPAVCTPLAVWLSRVAGVLAVAALGVVVLAVLGDGYVELVKHVWLGSYLLVVSALALAAGGVAVGRAAARRRAG